jgi:hypothetical protein
MAERRPTALQSVKIGPDAYAVGVEVQTDSDADDAPAKFWRNVDSALDLLGKIMEGRIPPDRKLRDVRLGMRVAAATIKAAIATDKSMLKAARSELPFPLKFSQKF